MKEEALALLAAETDPARKTHLLREYLQAIALRSFHESGAFANLSFVGGTALRFLFSLPRFSEDLDFSLEKPSGYDLRKWAGKLERDLGFGGFDASLTVKTGKTVESADIRAAGLLHEVGLAAHPAQKLSIKIEIDTRPPEGARTETRVVNRFFLMSLRHHDLPCLMAGKIRDLLTRPYSKGRDWYDLLWYRTRVPRVDPSIAFLQSSLDQGHEGTGGTPGHAADWQTLLEERARQVNWKAVAEDVAPFLERPAEKKLLTEAFMVAAIRGE